jgi:hypothetical protein
MNLLPEANLCLGVGGEAGASLVGTSGTGEVDVDGGHARVSDS